MKKFAQQLAKKYGTEEIAKEGSLGLAQIASALVNLGLMVADKAHLDHAVHQAEEHEEEARHETAADMSSTNDGLHKAAEMAAVHAGRLQAKTAMGIPWASMGNAAKGAAGGVGKAISAVAPGWKGKALMTAGVGAAGYGAYKAMQGTRDFFSEPTHSTQSWGQKRPVMHNVSEYGYPTF